MVTSPTVIYLSLVFGSCTLLLSSLLFALFEQQGMQSNDFNEVFEVFKKNEVDYINAQLSLRAETSVNIAHEMSEKVLNIMEFMDDLDDVQEVHTNAEFPDDFEVKDN